MADGDVSSASKSDQTSVSTTTSYSLHASDNPGALITSVTFTGDNYNEWSTELINALKAKRKIGFIDGTIPKPSITDPNFELWSSVNSMIVGWIRTSIEARVRSTVTFIADSHKLWENLKKRFAVGNKVRIHHLKEQLSSCKQDGQSVMDYYGHLAKMWEELDMFKPLPACSCSAAAEYEKEREDEKVHQFVMGSDESRFGGVCQGIIASDTLINLGEAYSKVVREEQRLTSTKEREAQHNAIGFATKKEPSEMSNTGQSQRGSQCLIVVGVVTIKQIVGNSWVFQIGGKKDHQGEVKTKDIEEVVVVEHQDLSATGTMEQRQIMLMQHHQIHQCFLRLQVINGNLLLRCLMKRKNHH